MEPTIDYNHKKSQYPFSFPNNYYIFELNHLKGKCFPGFKNRLKPV